MGLCYSAKKKKKTSKKKDKEVPGASDVLPKEKNDKLDEVDPENVTFEPFEQRGVLHIEDKLSTVGMTVLQENIYILSKNPSTISIHKNQEPFEKVDEVVLNEVDSPWDLASSPKFECLYITDCGTNAIFKMAAGNNELTSWQRDICYPHTLSVSEPDGHVVIVKYGKPSSLETFDHEAKMLRRIELPERIEYPKHAVRATSGNFFVSGKAKEDESWRVFEVTPEGEILRQTTESLAECHLAAGLGCHVIVADCWKNRILVLGPELTTSQALTPGYQWPLRIHYADSENLLYVLNGEKPKADEETSVVKKSDEEKQEETDENEDKVRGEKYGGSICIYGIRETPKH